jgi:PKD domain
MRLYPFSVGRGRWAALAITVTSFASLLVFASGAQAVMVDMNATGATVAFNSADTSNYDGVSLMPGACSDDFLNGNTCNALATSGITSVTSSAPCDDPALSSDLWEMGQANALPPNALCYHGGGVMHQNETYSLTWDPYRAYWSGTRAYVEQFLRDVADGSGTMTSPYALTQQYSDNGGRAENSSLYGGGCIDYGSAGGSKCDFGNPTGAGHDFPASSGCPVTGDSFTYVNSVSPNALCLTDAQLQGYLTTMITQAGIVARTQSGHTPMVALLLPPGVETCLDNVGMEQPGGLCSVNGSLIAPTPQVTTATTGGTVPAGTYRVEVTYVTAKGEQLPSASTSVTTTGGTSTIEIPSPPANSQATGWYAYVTQPNGTTFAQQQGLQTVGQDLTLSSRPTTGAAPPVGAAFCSYHGQVDVGGTEVSYVVQPWTVMTTCDEPDVPSLAPTATPQQISTNAGERLVSPLSRSQIAAIVNPNLNGWFAEYGAEIDDNGGCGPVPSNLDSVTVGSGSQNPYLLQREFNNAATLEFDPNTYFGCAPNVFLNPSFVVPSAVDPGDVVEFDGSDTASTLIVPNAGYAWNFGDGATATGPSVEHLYSKSGSYRVTLTVTDRGGYTESLAQTITVGATTSTPPPPNPPTGGGSGGSHGSSKLSARIQLLPQSLRGVLRSGITLTVRSNQAADGIATVMITRAAAKRAHIKVGRGASVVIGRGTVWQVKNGTVTLHLHLSKATVKKLKRLRALDLTVRLALVGSGGHTTLLAAGSY